MTPAAVLILALATPADTLRRVGIGVELRAYPVGQIVTTHLAGNASRLRWEVGLGYNRARRRDFGRHDDERGDGFGGGVTLTTPLRSHQRGWFAGGRIEYWRLPIDWHDNSPSRAGRSTTDVLQPTARFGFRANAGAADIRIGLDLGREINLKTDGEPVGQGWIGLLGIAVTIGAR